MFFINSIFLYAALSIDCFRCVSYNGANKACDDPFHNNVTTDILESPCMGGRKGRDGVFPATSCIKIAGIFGNYIVALFKNLFIKKKYPHHAQTIRENRLRCVDVRWTVER